MKRSSAAQAAGGAHFAFFFVSKSRAQSWARTWLRFIDMHLHPGKQQAIAHKQAAR